MFVCGLASNKANIKLLKEEDPFIIVRLPPLKGEINSLWYSHTMEYYTVVKNKLQNQHA